MTPVSHTRKSIETPTPAAAAEAGEGWSLEDAEVPRFSAVTYSHKTVCRKTLSEISEYLTLCSQ